MSLALTKLHAPYDINHMTHIINDLWDWKVQWIWFLSYGHLYIIKNDIKQGQNIFIQLYNLFIKLSDTFPKSDKMSFNLPVKSHQIKQNTHAPFFIAESWIPGSNRQKVENIVKIIQFQSMSLLNLRAKVLIGHFIPACTVYHIWIGPLSVAI